MNSNLAKCSCSHCDGHLEFDTAYAGARVACPHCGMETLLSNPVTAGPPPASSPAPSPTNPAAPAAYRLADSTGPRTMAPGPTAITPRNPNPFARQVARASWITFIFAYGFSALARQPGGSDLNPYLMITVPLFLLVGFALGVIALFGVRRHGTKGILIPAIVGLILDGVYLGAILVAILVGLSKRHELQETAASASSSTQSVTTGKVPVESTVKRPPRPGEPIVTLLEPGAEPRKVLRFQPKAGDKQIVAFRMKMAMDPSPLPNLPPITETTQITIKNVSANGDIDY